ncbi:MAG: hypothetical protein O2955_16700 [Planctomycetota bacterium]|nr:hypothetical protein [Planctomycetota bacterium]MDA1214154.1 hypothetical protein [Planctomycetota bacterium]
MLQVLSLLLMAVMFGETPPSETVPLIVPEGFHVDVYADELLVHDIYSLTVDAQGRVVVAGRGYVHTLLDTDGDGRADAIQEFADGPKTGAQGLYFDGNDLIASGDAGVIRYRDADGDGKADGPPETLLTIKAGGEHEVHSVQKGPDGYWYVIGGNYAGVTKETITRFRLPINNPRAGVLLRVNPDFREIELLADGFRNAYDFAFNSVGDIFTYDSDGERDISLPWYRPTRIFHAVPTADAGWVTRSWKRPNPFLDMMPVVANCGRGSPTGVICYRHRQFPESYRDAIFALDWTYGRVLVVRLDNNGNPISDEPELFMSAAGDYGFAPTDAEVGPDGSLFVSVGGRGLRGSVYRVTFEGDAASLQAQDGDSLAKCLNAPQPLASWSRARWIPASQQLGRDPFVHAMLDDMRTDTERIRAVEIIDELFGGIDVEMLERAAQDGNAHVKERIIRAAGGNHRIAWNASLLQPYLNDTHPAVKRATLESLLSDAQIEDLSRLVESFTACLDDDDRSVRQAAARVIRRMPADIVEHVYDVAARRGPRARLWFFWGRKRQVEYSLALVIDASGFALSVLDDASLKDLHADAARLLQIVWGDVGPKEGRAPVFDGYSATLNFSSYQSDVDAVKQKLAALYPLDSPVDFELARLLSMFEVDDVQVRENVLAQITDESDPVDDIHYLIVFSRLPGERSDDQRSRSATALLALDRKLTEKNYQTDSNWKDRVGEMFAQLVTYDPDLPLALLKHPEFGRPAHVMFLDPLPDDDLQMAIDAFTAKIAADGGDYPWTTDVVFLLNASNKSRDIALIREQYDDPSLQGAITIALADEPSADDRKKFVNGLSSWQYEVLEASTNALVALGPKNDPAEFVALLGAVRWLGDSNGEFPLREKLVKLLEQATGIETGFVYGEKGYAPQPLAIEKWTSELSKRYPQEVAGLFGTSELEMSDLQSRLAKIDWDNGDASRGQIQFHKRSCGHCHGGSQALGPSLSGVTKRFSLEELFTAIVFPNRDVSPRYQASSVVSKDGKIYHGMIIYESVDGFILRNATLQTHRFNTGEIESRSVSKTSMMPAGLLKELNDGDWADLYAYLKTLK